MNQSDAQTAPNYVTCPCQHCSGKIEFDVSELDPAENTMVPCPHCELETIIFVPKQKVPPVISGEIVDLKHPSEKFFDSSKSAADAKWQYQLGLISIREKDYAHAVKCFSNAAALGLPEAQSNLGVCYMDGLGVEKDEAEAVRWLLKAAEQGDADAEYGLGVAYFLGRGVSKDLSQAVFWWGRAAEHGNATSQSNIGICFEKGDGVAQDYLQAYKWMKLAAAQGYEGAQKKCEELALKMDVEQIGVLEPSHQILWKQERITPKYFLDFIGQNRVRTRLETATAAAKNRGEVLGHILLIGALGSGKSTLAKLIANAMLANFKGASATKIESESDLAGILVSLEDGDVLFIDQIDRLPKNILTLVCLAANELKLEVVLDRSVEPRKVLLNLPKFTLIGSAQRKERVNPDLLSCFSIIENMDSYSIVELANIACRFAAPFKIGLEVNAASRIASSSAGTPFDVLNRLLHVRDYAQVKGDGKITMEIAETALKMLGSQNEKLDLRESRDAIPSEIRREVWRRDEGKCRKCGSQANLEYDHIIPVSRGGSNTARNIELLCEVCNRAKSDLIQ